ncbi:unnamed protein product, partial [Symbiodinium sp. CCMP2456]
LDGVAASPDAVVRARVAQIKASPGWGISQTKWSSSSAFDGFVSCASSYLSSQPLASIWPSRSA